MEGHREMITQKLLIINEDGVSENEVKPSSLFDGTTENTFFKEHFKAGDVIILAIYLLCYHELEKA